MHRARRSVSRSAFTLIELLVTIGVVGIVIGILLPVLAGARRPALEVKSLSNLRTLGQTLDGYITQNQDRYPTVLPDVTNRISFNGDLGLTLSGDGARWATSHLWPAVIREYAPWPEHARSWLSPGADAAVRLMGPQGNGSAHFFPSYSMSRSFVASPTVWAAGANPTPDMIRPVRRSMVAHAAAKALAWDVDRAYLRRDASGGVDPKFKTPILFADGHAAARRMEDATPGFPNPLRDNDATPLHNTPGGVTGVDF